MRARGAARTAEHHALEEKGAGMKSGRSRAGRAAVALCALVALALATASLASCGGSGVSEGGTTTKLPPGVEETAVAESSAPSGTTSSTQEKAGTGEEDSGEEQDLSAVTTPNTAVDLAGARFTVASATRPDSNKSVVGSGGREVGGDYFEVELEVQNVGTDLVDLSAYSFRLTSPGIPADTYSDYYGNTGTYGAYASGDTISASLLSYSDLSTVSYLMKVGEQVDEVFLFFDLNPENVARNAGVTRENSTLIIRKVSGTGYGTQVTVPLAGYPD